MSVPRPASPPSGAADHDRILEAVGIAVMTIDASGTLVEVNDAAVRMFGHPREALLGRNVRMLMPAHHADAHDGYLRHHLETGEERIIGRGRKVEGVRADGSRFPMHLAVGRFELDGAPRFTGIVHDLSEPERDHQAATRLGRIVEESVNEIYVFDATTLAFTIVNASAAANLGYTVETLRTMTPVDIKPEYDRASFEAMLEPLRQGKVDRLRVKTVHERRGGDRYDVEIVMHLSHASYPPEFVAIVTDVTEHNRMLGAIQQSQKMDAIGQLTGGIAHDFNNLLTVVSGNLELLEMTLDDPDARELVEEARAASAMGANLTSRLLSFARKSSLSSAPLDLNEHVLGLSDLLRRSLGEAISLDLRLAPRLWPVALDASLAESALVNLAINARDAMDGSGRLIIETANVTLEENAAAALDIVAGDYVSLSVTDIGPGIAPANVSRVFEPFYTTKSDRGGHGLGLSMVYGFARQSGGHVAAENGVGGGARFTLHLPRSVEAEPQDVDPLPTLRATPQRRRRVLVVEDNDRVRRLNVRRLRQLGHETLEAADGPSAIAVFEADANIDVLFTDMIMPNGLSGLELARALRKRRPALPVLIASGYSDELLVPDALAAEDIVLLRKPYDGNALADAMTGTLRPVRGDER